MSKTGKLVTTDEEKAELLNSFASVFTGSLSSYTSQADGLQDWGPRGIPPTIREDQVSDDLRNLIIHKSMGPDEIGQCSCQPTLYHI